MSRKVREWLMLSQLFDQTTHEDRVKIDKEIEKRTGVNCDEAIEKGLISKKEFRDIVKMILEKKKKKKAEVLMVV